MTSALGTGPFLFVQGVNNDPAAILRILDTKYQGSDTSSVMSAVNEFTTKKYRPDQHVEMFVAEFEGLAMRLGAIGHGVSEQMRVVNFLNSLSEVSALSAILSALRVIDNLSWTKATTQILLESELKGVNSNGPERPERAVVANNRFNGTCYTCGKVDHRSSDHIVHGRHQSRHPMRRYGGHGGVHHADSRQRDRHVDHRQGHGGARPGGARQGGAGHEEDFHENGRQGGDQYRARFSNDGNNDWRNARTAPAIVYHHRDQFNHANYRTTTSSTAPLQPLWPRTMLVTNSTRRQLWLIPMPRGTCSTICPSSTNSSLSHPRLSNWATTRQPTVLIL
jgi:gag-polypeptide of LTR copia-type